MGKWTTEQLGSVVNVGDRSRPAPFSSFNPGSSGVQVPLELRERVDDPAEQLSGRCGRVDLLGQEPELDPAPLELFTRIERVTQGAESAAHLPGHKRIAGIEHLSRQLKAETDTGHGGYPLIFKDARTTGGLQRIALEVEMLFVGTDARIADDRQVQPPSCCRRGWRDRPPHRVDKRAPFW